MKIGVLTSSRADYGIYLPLLKAMQQDPFFDLRLIVFGTHLSRFHGHTVDAIVEDGFTIDYRVDHVPDADTPEAIAQSMTAAASGFIPIWQKEQKGYDLVFCLGDRFEMFAAVSIAAPFQIKFAHLHGGETTLGAIDNEFRHCLTLFSSLHFTATELYAKRVAEIKGTADSVYAVGSLSLDNLAEMDLLSEQELKDRFGIDLSMPGLLVTFHPETVGADNEMNAKELVKALEHFTGYRIIITMPNADTRGKLMRQVYENFAKGNSNVVLVENLGTQGYFSCMEQCRLVIGNSSSGIIEAASFGKYVVNIGDRQKGRAVSSNLLQCRPEADEIIKTCAEALSRGRYAGANIYYKKNVAQSIIEILKNGRERTI
jgi:GDP/UDP-N,N'-diacetylbacillosamine 2-epimerase (hydrolysing)